MSLFQSNLRKQIRNLPKILNFVKKNRYYSKLFTSVLRIDPAAGILAGCGGPAGLRPRVAFCRERLSPRTRRCWGPEEGHGERPARLSEVGS